MDLQNKMVPVKIKRDIKTGNLSLVYVDRPVRILVENAFNKEINANEEEPETRNVYMRNWFITACYIVPKKSVLYCENVELNFESRKVHYKECIKVTNKLVPQRWVETAILKINLK